MKFPSRFSLRSLIGLLVVLLGGSLPVATAGEFKMLDEAWINGRSDTTWGESQPDFLGARSLGQETAWVTYLAVKVAGAVGYEEPSKLVLQFTPPESGEGSSAGSYRLYGLPKAQWTRQSLTGANAPGWDGETFAIEPGLDPLSEVVVTDEEAETLEFRLNRSVVAEFFADNQGRSVTLIVVKDGGRTSKFVSTFSDPERGPRIEF